MTGRDRVYNAVRGGPLDRIPRYDAFWEDTLSRWRTEGLGENEEPETRFGFDFRLMHIDASMRRPQAILSEDETSFVFADRAGYTARKMKGRSRALEWLDHVTKDKETWQKLKDGFTLDPEDKARVDTASYFAHHAPYPTWTEAKQRFDALRATGAFIAFAVYGPWEATWRHRGYTALLMDLAMDPAWVEEMAECQARLVLAVLEACDARGMRPDGLFLIDDLACTRGPLFNPALWRDLFQPLYARYAAFLHARDMLFLLHCCGDCRAFIPGFIAAGLDVLQPLQAAAGLDVRALKAEYGHALAWWGNIDVRRLAESPDEAVAEIREKVPEAKEGGGYLYHSDHSVPPEVSWACYGKMLEELDRCGAY